jgi:hypothetical protein
MISDLPDLQAILAHWAAFVKAFENQRYARQAHAFKNKGKNRMRKKDMALMSAPTFWTGEELLSRCRRHIQASIDLDERALPLLHSDGPKVPAFSISAAEIEDFGGTAAEFRELLDELAACGLITRLEPEAEARYTLWLNPSLIWLSSQA